MTKEASGLQTVPISRAQAALLAREQAGVAAAQERLNLVATVILAGHGITSGAVESVSLDSDPPQVTVRIAPPEPEP